MQQVNLLSMILSYLCLYVKIEKTLYRHCGVLAIIGSKVT